MCRDYASAVSAMCGRSIRLVTRWVLWPICIQSDCTLRILSTTQHSALRLSASYLDAGEGSHQFLHARADEGDGHFLVITEIADGDDGTIAKLGMRHFVAG